MQNNEVLKKLRVALQLKDADIIEILALVDFQISKGALGDLFRAEDHPNFVEAGDQILRNFLNGLVIHMRGPEIKRDRIKPPQKFIDGRNPKPQVPKEKWSGLRGDAEDDDNGAEEAPKRIFDRNFERSPREERKPFNRDDRGSYDDRRSNGDDRKPRFDNDRKPFNRDDRRSSFDGDKRFSRDDRRPFDDDRRSFDNDDSKPRFDNDRKPPFRERDESRGNDRPRFSDQSKGRFGKDESRDSNDEFVEKKRREDDQSNDKKSLFDKDHFNKKD